MVGGGGGRRGLRGGVSETGADDDDDTANTDRQTGAGDELLVPTAVGCFLRPVQSGREGRQMPGTVHMITLLLLVENED